MTTEFLSRSAWATKEMEVATTKLDPKKVKRLSVHYPGSGAEQFVGLNKTQIISRIRGWYKYHTEGHGWSDIGYQVAIDPAGRVWDLRGIDKKPAAVGEDNYDWNKECGAVLFIVGNDEPPTDEALTAFRDFYKNKWLKKYPKATDVVGHGDIGTNNTLCPGTTLLAMCRSGELVKGIDTQEDDDMFTDQDRARLNSVYQDVSVDTDGKPSPSTVLGRIQLEQSKQAEKLDAVLKLLTEEAE